MTDDDTNSTIEAHPEGPAVEENPDGFVRYPTNHIYAFVDDPATNMPLIYGDIMAEQVATDAVHIYRGQLGLENLSPTGKDYGLRERIQRFVVSLGYERVHLEQVEDELHAGHAFVGVAVDDDETKLAVARILRRHGAHDIKHYGRLTIEDL